MVGSRPNCNPNSKLRYTTVTDEAPPELRPPEWPFRQGDLVEVELLGQGERQSWRRYRGRIIALTPNVLTINAGKYPVSVAKWAWWAGYAKVAKLA